MFVGQAFVEDLTAVEGIKQQRRVRPEVGHDKVAWQSNSMYRYSRAPGDLDIDHREQDRQATPRGEHQVEHRVVGVVVVLALAAEAVAPTQQLSARGCDAVGIAACPSRAQRQLRAEGVEHGHGPGGVDLAKFSGHCEGQEVQWRVSGDGKLGERGVHVLPRWWMVEHYAVDASEPVWVILLLFGYAAAAPLVSEDLVH